MLFHKGGQPGPSTCDGAARQGRECPRGTGVVGIWLEKTRSMLTGGTRD
jgi:hypothetical protein